MLRNKGTAQKFFLGSRGLYAYPHPVIWALGEAVVSYKLLLLRASQGMQVVAISLIGIVGLGFLGFTIGSALGYLPWLEFEARFGDYTYLHAGQAVQIGVTALFLLLFFFIPSQTRILSLEKAHRDFRISMEDVAHAYHLCHSADRAGVFTMSSEFDQVRERLAFLRDHPDLPELETDVLTVAAQMSQQARRLADIYSDDKVRRAKEFLAQRQQEAETQQALIVEALHVCREIRRWTQQIELEESVVASQLEQLDEQLRAALPKLGYMMDADYSVPYFDTEDGDGSGPDMTLMRKRMSVFQLSRTAAE